MGFVDFITIVIAIVVSVLITIYLGKRWLFWFDFNFIGYHQFIYWIVVFIAGLSLTFSKIFNNISTYWLPLCCNVITGLMICCVFTSLIFDTVRWLSKKKVKPNLWLKIVYIIASVLLFCFGHEMAINPKIVHYQVKIDKPANVEHLRIVQLSDIHLNEQTTHRFIQQMVDEVNKLNADFIVITGDTLDKRLKPFTQNGFDKQFQQLRSKYGTYIIFGNHEYLATNLENNREEDIANAFRQAGMKVLKDDIIYFDDIGITLVGRDDFSSFRYNVNRASLADLIMFTNTDSPIILLDHQPKDLTEPEKLGVDLMISGHTHAGQIFPINIIEKLMYKNTYGLYRNEDHHFSSIVSSGYGFWGPPIRLMTRSEIVVMDIVFDKNTHNE
ncbi:metallophosphoesterase [Gilliamella sp. ESL0250]|uniref:metallophosphoesterase n=1 Tax=Gilliamella sp. ESL0250 TaxID=2705036 RepID=UPI00157FC2CE|nr:metallophosphoesterase [Gilliamella sp. ESL0250]NUF50520.1 metallophosphoesterase [Gilliamella sp. ESL0250]